MSILFIASLLRIVIFFSYFILRIRLLCFAQEKTLKPFTLRAYFSVCLGYNVPRRQHTVLYIHDRVITTIVMCIGTCSLQMSNWMEFDEQCDCLQAILRSKSCECQFIWLFVTNDGLLDLHLDSADILKTSTNYVI